MQSCSVHHCVLFLLTLTLTTDPGSAAEFPIYAKLYQPVTLPCEHECSGQAKWSLTDNHDDVFAECDQTSCRSLKEGYEMSRDGYLRGDLSLTITNPDYSLRKTYMCDCGISNIATWVLRIDTVSSAVQKSSGEDLKLDLSVPEPVEVIYRGSVLGDGVQICNVTQHSLQCKSEYTPRTSLSYPELTLRHMERSESGTYIIRNLNFKEDIRVYAVSVSGLTNGETAMIVIVLLLLVAGLLIATLILCRQKAADQKAKRRMKAVDELISQALHKPPVEVEKALQEVENVINDLDQNYGGNSKYSEHVGLFCDKKRSELLLRRALLATRMACLQPVTGEVKKQMEAVDELINQAQLKPPEKVEEALQRVEATINNLEQIINEDKEYSEHVELFCNSKRLQLDLCRTLYGTRMGFLQPVTGDVKSQMKAVDELIKLALHKPPVELEKALQEAEKVINDLEQEYEGDREYSEHVGLFCDSKRKELELYRMLFAPRMPCLQSVTKEVKNRIEEVNKLFNQAQLKPPGEVEEALWEVEKKINALKQKYRGDREHSEQVELFCYSKRTELDVYRNLFATQMGFLQPVTGELMKKVEEVGRILQDLKHGVRARQMFDKCFWIKSHLQWINSRCSEQREELNKFKQQLSHGSRDAIIIHNMETHLNGLEQWCVDKEFELEGCRKKLISGGHFNVEPKAALDGGEERDLLLHKFYFAQHDGFM